jgi:valyl-tRNA synthetase
MSLDAVKSGSITIIPDRFEKVYYHWMENLHDWCISRQIWFGHRIPVWYHEAKCIPRAGQEHDVANCEEMIVAVEEPTCKHCDAKYVQDPDALDTWFSSGTWTFSALGWPDNVEDPKGDFQRFHPTQLLETGYDIIFFWVARMILMTTYVTGAIPFEKVYLHGLVRDEQGRKMSKSLGNILDPLDVAAKYGTDAVRLSLTIGNTPGNDLRISDEKIAYFRNFTNKLWNISRFALMNVSELRVPEGRPEPKTVADRWILNRLDAVTRSMTDDLEHLSLGRPAETLRDFTWGELADWYLEIAKIEAPLHPSGFGGQGKDAMLSYLLYNVLKLWHPFMPFVTEEIYGKTFAKGADDFLMVASWPEVRASEPEFHDGFDVLREVITALRNIRSTHNVEAGKRIEATLVSAEHATVLTENAEVIKVLAKVETLTVVKPSSAEATEGKPENAASALAAGVQIYVPLGGLVDAEAEKARIGKEIAEVEKYAKALEGKLGNADFTSRAPEHVVETERGKLAAAQEKAEKLRAQLAELG